MKQQKTQRIFTCILVFVLFISSLKAQEWNNVLQSEVNTVVQEMEDIYGNIVDIEYNQVNYFLNSLLAGSSPTGACPPPNPVSIYEYNANGVRFEWNNMPTAQKYRIAYLNLETGNQGQSTYSPSANNLYNLYNIPDGLYLFAVQTSCNSVKGGLAIIIAEKDIFLLVDEDMPCNCPSKNTIPFANVNIPLTPGDEFMIKFENSGSSIYKLRGKVELDGNVSVNPYCPADILQTAEMVNNIVYVDGLTGALLVTHEGAELNINTPGIDAFFMYCDGAFPDRDPIAALTTDHSTSNQFLLYPNPVKDQFQLSFTLDQEAIVSTQLVHVNGQIIQQFSKGERFSKGQQSLEFSLSDAHPKGFYFVQIMINQEPHYLKFCKK